MRPAHFSSRNGLLAVAIALALTTPESVFASSTITVSQPGDLHVSGKCTLREALATAGATSVPDTDCGPPVLSPGTTVAIPYPRIELVQGPLATNAPMVIAGTAPGGRTTITHTAGALPNPIFVVGSHSSSLTLSNLEITGGHGQNGGGIAAKGDVTVSGCLVTGNTASGDGGGIYGEKLTVIDSVVSGNTADRGGGIALAAGKYNPIIERSTISGNQAHAGGGVFVTGLGFYSTGALLSVRNSTISGNTAQGPSGADAFGGGIYIGDMDALDVRNSTIVNNKSSKVGDGGGIFMRIGNYSQYQYATLVSTIVAANYAGKYEENIASSANWTIDGNHDLIRRSAAGISVPVDTLNCAAQLRALADNGGPTPTHALIGTSCAIDQGTDNGETTDQRGYARVVGLNADIGAFEYDERIFTDGFD